MDQSLVSVMRGIKDAMSLDSTKKHQEAYIQYLECTLRIMSNLLHNVRAGGGVVVTKEVRRHVQLGQQCLGRVAALLDEIGQEQGKQMSAGATTPSSAPLYSISSEQMSHAYGKHKGPSPMEIAFMQNQRLQAAYKARLARMNRRHPDTASLSLTLQRKMAENLAIAKAQEEALSRKLHERQARLEEQAARRFHTPVGLSEEEHFQRETYKRILDFEQDNPRLAQLRGRLEQSSGEEMLINQLVQEILSHPCHPLSEMLQRQRDEIIQSLTPLVTPHLHLLSRITVPLPANLWPPTDSPQSASPAGEWNAPADLGQGEEDLKEQEEEDLKEQREEVLKEQGEEDLKEQGEEDLKEQGEEDLKEQGEEAEESRAGEEAEESRAGEEAGNQDAQSQKSEGEERGEPSGEVAPDSGAGVADRNNSASAARGAGADPDLKTSPSAGSMEGADEEGFAGAMSSARRDVASAISQGNRLTKQLTRENQTASRVLRQISQDYDSYNQENMDDLFEDSDDGSLDSENEKPECERCSEPAAVAVAAPASARSGGDSSQQVAGQPAENSSTPRGPELPEQRNGNGPPAGSPGAGRTAPPASLGPGLGLGVGVNQEALQGCLSQVTSLIQRSCEQLQVMFIIAYQQLESPEAREQVYASLEEHIFKPVWKYLLPLFRLANLDSELRLACYMSQHPDPLPADFGVRGKLQLHGSGQTPYLAAVQELAKLKNYYTFLSKLECVVRVCRQVCTCVADHYGEGRDGGKSSPSIGADDLLPILTYVVVKSREPQLYAECLAMEEFIHEGYLMCEEGYCLTTLQTAISFITKPRHDQ